MAVGPGDLYQPVDVCAGGNAYGTAGARYQSDLFRQYPRYSVLCDSARMAAADLHYADLRTVIVF